MEKTRSAGIDVLRALFALWVMLFAHLIPWQSYVGSPIPVLSAFAKHLVTFFQGGAANDLPTHPAVIAFIVLSGYCIHKSGLRYGVGAYAIRRLFRIYPIYLAATLLGIIAWMISIHHNPQMGLSGTTALYPGCIAAKLTALPSVVPHFAERYCRYQGNGPLDTVMVEMALYAVYPALFIFIGRRWPLAMWATVAVIWLASLAIVWQVPAWRWWWNNSSLFGFLLFWWLGAALVHPRVQAFFSSWLVTVAISLAIAGLGYHSLKHPQMGLLTIEARKIMIAAMACCLIVRYQMFGRTLGRVAPLGEAGYSLYALHAPLCYTALVFGAPWWAAAGGTIVVALASFRFFEDPIHQFGKRRAIEYGQTSDSPPNADPTPSASRSMAEATQPAE